MKETAFLADVLIFLAAAVTVVTLFRRINVSPVIGYLAAGMIIGPHGLGLIQHAESLDGFAELGVVFLMFSIGLELTLKRLVTMRGQLFGLGAAQLLVSGVALGLAALAVGLDARAAVVVGAGLALSSTAVVLQLLGERGEIVGRVGRVALAILLFQDLAVVPLIVMVPQLGAPGTSMFLALGISLAKAIAVLAVITLVGRRVLRPVFRFIAARRAPELLVGLSLLVILGAGFATAAAGLSLALGAFLAGLLVAETEFRHQVEADMAPFRGILLSLFFMTVGMGVDFGLLASDGWRILVLVLAILAIKVVTIAGVGLAFRLPPGLALREGLLLAECGEFAFILFAMAMGVGLLDMHTGRLLMLAVAATLVVTPLLAALGRRVEASFAAEARGLERIASETEDLTGHVLVLGYGRVGGTIGHMLVRRAMPFIGLDLDPARVAAARAQGLPVFYGDASSRAVLHAARGEFAVMAVITLDDPAATARAVMAVRERCPELPIYARAQDAVHSAQLARLGATGIVPEIVEVSLQLGAEVLRATGMPEEEVTHLVTETRGQVVAEGAGRGKA